jgi:hypothetical protein
MSRKVDIRNGGTHWWLSGYAGAGDQTASANGEHAPRSQGPAVMVGDGTSHDMLTLRLRSGQAVGPGYGKDRISHDAILDKLHTIRPIERLVRGWLKAGIVDHFDFGWNIRLGLPRTAVSSGQVSHSHLPGQTRLQDLHQTQSPCIATPTGQAAGHHPTTSRCAASRSRLRPQSCDPGLGQLLPVLRRQARFPNPGQHPLPPTHPLGQIPPPTQERKVVLSPLLAQGERASALQRW